MTFFYTLIFLGGFLGFMALNGFYTGLANYMYCMGGANNNGGDTGAYCAWTDASFDGEGTFVAT